MTASVRSALSAGLTAGLVAATTGAVLTAPAPHVPAIASPAVELSAFVSANVAGPTTSPGDVIINAYYAVQPWVQWGFEVGAWAFSWLPWPIGLLGPQINIAYTFWQPLTESVVFSLAFLVDGQFDLVWPTLTTGVQTAVNNLITGEINWISSFLPPLPPLPFPVFPGAATAATTQSAPATRGPAAARALAPAAPASEVGPSTAASAENPDVAETPEPIVAPVTAEVPDAAVTVDAPQPRRQTSRAAVRAAQTAAAVPTAAAAVSEAEPVSRGAATSTRRAADSAATQTPRAARSTR